MIKDKTDDQLKAEMWGLMSEWLYDNPIYYMPSSTPRILSQDYFNKDVVKARRKAKRIAAFKIADELGDIIKNEKKAAYK